MAQTTTETINNAQGLIDLFNGASGNTVDAHFVINQNIDFSGASSSLPLGSTSDGNCKTFTGSFDG